MQYNTNELHNITSIPSDSTYLTVERTIVLEHLLNMFPDFFQVLVMVNHNKLYSYIYFSILTCLFLWQVYVGICCAYKHFTMSM